MIALNGVRSSWLMLARKSLLAWLAPRRASTVAASLSLSAACSAATTARSAVSAVRMLMMASSLRSSSWNRLGYAKTSTTAPLMPPPASKGRTLTRRPSTASASGLAAGSAWAVA